MSESRMDASERSSTNEFQGFSSFSSFRKSNGSAGTQKIRFIEHDPGKERKSGRRTSPKQGSSVPIEGGLLEDDPTTSALKRRDQVYHAQKRHRDRKAEYVKSLEAEVARLQHLDALVNSEKNNLAHQNEAIKAFLATQSPDVQPESVNLGSPPAPTEDLSSLGGAWIDIRFDPEVGHERTFIDVDLPDVTCPSGNVVRSRQPSRRPTRQGPVQGDSWAALDFILALEWPCQGHIKHAINPDAFVPIACETSGLHGHALTATQAVYQSARPPPSTQHECSQCVCSMTPVQQDLDSTIRDKWQLPHSEIDKLVELSEQLELDDELMTPAQAYAMVRMELPSDDLLRPVLGKLKVRLASIVQCSGFGTVMPSVKFYQHFDDVLSCLSDRSSEVR